VANAKIQYAYFGISGRHAAPVTHGPVPAAELAGLSRRFARPADYPDLLRQVTDLRVLALHGHRGTGRKSTALYLLAEAAGGNVMRLDPAASWENLADLDFAPDTGYLFEPRALDLEPDALLMHFDRLSGRLSQVGAYAVVVIEGTGTSEPLVRSRYGRAGTAPAAKDVVAAHLGDSFAAESEEALEAIRALSTGPDIVKAVGLEELLPAEAALLADLVAAEHRGEHDREAVLAVCRTIVPRQVHSWFADLHRYGAQSDSGPLAQAALSLAVAVYNGASYDLTAEAAEQLLWELAVTADPETTPGRAIAGQDPRTRLRAVRARLGEGTEQVGRASVPVRTAGFESDRLAGAVLGHAWERHHNLRGPLVRWLQSLGENRRTVAWMRAALALGVLATFDFPHVFNEAILPAAGSGRVRGQLFAATALDLAARDETVRPAIRSLVRDWRRAGPASLLITAAFVHGYGRAAGSVAESVRELRGIGIAEDGKYAAYASQNLVQLLGGAEPGTVLDRILAWIGEDNRDAADLGLLAVLRMCATRVGDVWDPDADAGLAPFESWPLPLGLVTVRPELRDAVADALWVALRTGRTGATALIALSGWLRRSGSDEALQRATERFLPQLINDVDDCERLRHLVQLLADDPEEPLDRHVAQRLVDVLEREKEKL
jgi:hypothetical protein